MRWSHELSQPKQQTHPIDTSASSMFAGDSADTQGGSAEPLLKPRYKVVLLGDTGVGKSSLLHRWASDTQPPESMDATIGASFSPVVRDDFVLDVWDTAGQERYRSLVPMYGRNAHVALLVSDASDRLGGAVTGLDRQNWLCNVGSDTAVIDVRNKVDKLIGIRPRATAEDLEEARGEPVRFVSAWTGEGMETILTRIVELAREVDSSRPATRLSIDGGRVGRGSMRNDDGGIVGMMCGGC